MSAGPSIGEADERVARSVSLAAPSSRLRYVSAARFEALERLGLNRVRDVLLHVPHRYLDFSRVERIAFADLGSEVTVVGTIDRIALKRPRPRMQIVEIMVVDETGVLKAVFFKQPWVAEQLHKGDVVALSGKVTYDFGFRQMRSPFYERLGSAGEALQLARVVPVHPTTEGISVSWMRRIVSAAIADAGDVCDVLPARLVSERGLPTRARAIRDVHFPPSLEAAECARRRLAYEELLCLQLALLSRRTVELEGVRPARHRIDGPCLAALKRALPFELTGEQEQAVREILFDMAAPAVMNRLLLGDVGTGKTAVAACALAAVADSGTQAAMMAPTSVLAAQYATKLGPILSAAGISWALVTGATRDAERKEAVAAIAAGEMSVVFGTTALLSDDVAFAALSLVVIDEQHRFGVGQRVALREKGRGADQLTMSATPIPRTLALSLYGDLDLSRIRTRPVPGAGISTKALAPENLDIAYGAIRDAVAEGRQAYVICPLVDDDDDGRELEETPEQTRSGAQSLHAAVRVARELAEHTLSELRVGLLHGRMSAAGKESVMARFNAGEIDVLVSTTVVEVGVDVPNASVMLVFDADRFGLATLHQLRGRVGRGEHAGEVYLACAAKEGTPARRRLSALEATSDGFELAELDLKLRHEGELLGYRQHGGVSLKIVDLATDTDLVSWAHDDARAISKLDPSLKSAGHRALAHEVADRFGAYFEEVGRA